MGYKITGRQGAKHGKKGKMVTVYRATLAEAKRHASAARAFGGTNIKITKV